MGKKVTVPFWLCAQDILQPQYKSYEWNHCARFYFLRSLSQSQVKMFRTEVSFFIMHAQWPFSSFDSWNVITFSGAMAPSCGSEKKSDCMALIPGQVWGRIEAAMYLSSPVLTFSYKERYVFFCRNWAYRKEELNPPGTARICFQCFFRRLVHFWLLELGWGKNVSRSI